MIPGINANEFPSGGGGFGELEGTHNLHELSKALQAGTGVDASSFTGGRALTPESLENTLVNVLWSQDEARLFKRIKKTPIQSPMHQWNKRTAVGDFNGGWTPEGGTSVEADQTIDRMYAQAKYLQTLRKATLQATLSNMIENALTIEQNAGALWIIHQIEHALFYGNSDFVAEEPDGLLKQINTPDNILDARGANAGSRTFINQVHTGARVIRENFGQADLVLASPTVVQDIQKQMAAETRFGPSLNPALNAIANTIATPFGNVELVDDVFIKEGQRPSPSSLAGRPAAPTQRANPAASGAGSQFGAVDVGKYNYVVAAINRYGESDGLNQVINRVTAGQSVTLSINHGRDVTALKIYRSKKDADSYDDCRYMDTIAVANPGVSTTTSYVDDNSDLPGTSQVFLLTMSGVREAIEWFQFLPLMKFDLYPTNQAVYPFLMLLFGAMALKKNEQHSYVKNVSPESLNWF